MNKATRDGPILFLIPEFFALATLWNWQDFRSDHNGFRLAPE
jgi:hypothetical protein